MAEDLNPSFYNKEKHKLNLMVVFYSILILSFLINPNNIYNLSNNKLLKRYGKWKINNMWEWVRIDNHRRLRGILPLQHYSFFLHNSQIFLRSPSAKHQIYPKKYICCWNRKTVNWTRDGCTEEASEQAQRPSRQATTGTHHSLLLDSLFGSREKVQEMEALDSD